MKLIIGFITCMMLLSQTGYAREIDPQQFTLWLQDVKAEAIDAGVSVSLVEKAFKDLKPNNKVLASDRRQPEFSLGFWEYYSRGVNPNRVKKGKSKYFKDKEIIEKISGKHHVQSRFLMAFWGLESDFGDYKGDQSLVQNLATLAYDPRRGDFFRKELIQLLLIIEDGHLSLEDAYGSWAGAFGHTQFMPSTFKAYAIDGDNDGKKNVIGSHVDALYSAANYLKKMGWDDSESWGREVTVPDNFDYKIADLSLRYPLSHWSSLGITATDGSTLPNIDIEAALLVPSGSYGPAFLVYDNFHLIMNWNRSIFFALNVSLLSDYIGNNEQLKFKKPVDYKPLATKTIIKIQRTLNRIGFDTGAPDGVIGRQTRFAIGEFQLQHGLPQDKYPNPEMLEILFSKRYNPE